MPIRAHFRVLNRAFGSICIPLWNGRLSEDWSDAKTMKLPGSEWTRSLSEKGRDYISLLNEAVDKTRCKEPRELPKDNDERLKGTKYDWLKGMENLSDESVGRQLEPSRNRIG